jgi:hypothetical protein
MESWDHDCRSIEGCVLVAICSCAGIGGCRGVIHLDVEKGVGTDHILTHGVRPFKDLRTYVHQEGVGRPAAEDHDFGGRDIIYEEWHGRARSDRFVADLVGVKAKSGFARECVAGVAEEI